MNIRNGRKSFLPHGSFGRDEDPAESSHDECELDSEGAFVGHHVYTQLETIGQHSDQTRKRMRTSDQQFRNKYASKNPVLVLPDKRISAWDGLPRMTVMDTELKGMIPKPEVLGFWNKQI